MIILLPGCLVQSCRLSSCEAFVPLERLPALLSGRTTACIAKVGDVHGAAPLQAAIRSIVDKLGGLCGFSGTAPL